MLRRCLIAVLNLSPLLLAAGHAGEWLHPSGRSLLLDEIAPGKALAVVVVRNADSRIDSHQLYRFSPGADAVRPLGAEIVAVSPHALGANRKLSRALGLRFPLFSARGAAAFNRLGLWDEGAQRPYSGVVFIDRCGEIVERHLRRAPSDRQEDWVIPRLVSLARQPDACAEST